MDGGLLGHAHLTDPRPFWKKPRNESLRLRGKPFGFWVATCYDDALMFARNPQCFSWELELAFGLALSTRGGRDAGAGVGFLSMIQDDRPDPGRLPRVPSRVFPPRRIAAMDPRIRGRAGQPVSKLRQRHAEGGVSTSTRRLRGRSQPTSSLRSLACRIPRSSNVSRSGLARLAWRAAVTTRPTFVHVPSE